MSGRRPRGWLLASALAAGLLASTPAGAREPLVVGLAYEVDPALSGCPSRAEFQGGVVKELGYDPFRETAARRIVVRLRGAGGRLDGDVEWRGANDEWEGERGFSSRRESCAQIARAMALATAIQIQLLAGAEGAAPPAAPAPSPPPPPAPPPVAVAQPAAAAPPPEREAWLAVDVGGGVMRDVGDAPTTLLPRIAVSVGRPAAIGLRLAASGFGPEAELDRPEGGGRIDRLLVTLALIRYFRAGHAVEPLVTLGAGWHRLHARGFSDMPSVAEAHTGTVSSAVATGSGGVAFVVDPRIAVVVEAEALLLWPSVRVQIASAEAAHFGAVTLFAHAGLLARF
jgi:hypothetical protein